MGRVYISHDVIFDEAIFSFSELKPNASARYTAEVLLLPNERTTSESSMNNILPNTTMSAPILLACVPMQPQRIPASAFAPVMGPDPSADPLPPCGNDSGAEIQAELLPVSSSVDHSLCVSCGRVVSSPRAGPSAPAPAHLSSQAPTDVSAPTARTSGSTPTISASARAPPLNNAPCTRLQSGITKPKNYSDGTFCYGNFAASEEPRNLSMTLSNLNWKSAMESEYSALVQNNTWHLVPPASGRNVIDCKLYIKLSTKLMALLIDTKLTLWLKVLSNATVLIMMIFSVQWLNLLLYALCYHLLFLRAGPFGSWMRRTHFSMVF
jgi:hypothetical protein